MGALLEVRSEGCIVYHRAGALVLTADGADHLTYAPCEEGERWTTQVVEGGGLYGHGATHKGESSHAEVHGTVTAFVYSIHYTSAGAMP